MIKAIWNWVKGATRMNIEDRVILVTENDGTKNLYYVENHIDYDVLGPYTRMQDAKGVRTRVINSYKRS